ncbi:SCP2 sterol-binding domain-containing protein [Micromonospora sp. NPDC093243]
MLDPTTEYFEGLGRRGHERRLEAVSGILRFDLRRDHGTDHWLVAIEKGNVTVSRECNPADLILRADGGVFDLIASGVTHPVAAWLRNELTLEGDQRLSALFVRTLPERPGVRHRRRPVGEGRAAR